MLTELDQAQKIVGTALDQSQKLFGRGFLIAGGGPTLLFAVIGGYLLYGYAWLQSSVLAWIGLGWQEALFQIALLLVAVYLAAQVVYGLRTAALQVYQGEWPGPLAWLRPVGIALATKTMRRYEAREEAILEVLTDFAWAREFQFGETFSPVEVAEEEVRRRQQQVHAAHERLAGQVRQGRRWREGAYGEILHEARLLQANRDRFSPDLQADVDALVAVVAARYREHLPLRAAVEHLWEATFREWIEASEARAANFPEHERWLRPTQMGNVAAALEAYPFDRYGIGLSALWPRLVPILPEEVRLRIEDATTSLDFTVLISLLSLAAAVGAAGIALYGPPRDRAFEVAIPLALALAGWLFYRLAISATRALGVQVQATVDLFRLDLLDALEIERPSTPEQEKAIWTELRHFIAQADLPAHHVRFKQAPERKEAPSDPPPSLWDCLRTSLIRRPRR